MLAHRVHRRAFSLIELVIVVVIIGIIAAIAIPRMSRGASGATQSSLEANIRVLQSAIDLYETEHAAFPSGTAIADQLLGYTDAAGNVSPTGQKTGEFVFGPYLRAIPANPSGVNKGLSGIGTADGPTIGWIYDPATGTITDNTN
jgi:prepilin-type N-terminal cleavage/methylation domain-containing protein